MAPYNNRSRGPRSRVGSIISHLQIFHKPPGTSRAPAAGGLRGPCQPRTRPRRPPICRAPPFVPQSRGVCRRYRLRP
nr:MAG TPA: hypothetical protein [Caudoviricetes sp.]